MAINYFVYLSSHLTYIFNNIALCLSRTTIVLLFEIYMNYAKLCGRVSLSGLLESERVLGHNEKVPGGAHQMHTIKHAGHGKEVDIVWVEGSGIGKVAR
jgi:hypothetical protein